MQEWTKNMEIQLQAEQSKNIDLSAQLHLDCSKLK